MSTERIVFVGVMVVIAGVYLAIMIPQFLRSKQLMREAELNYARYMAEYDRWMRGE